MVHRLRARWNRLSKQRQQGEEGEARGCSSCQYREGVYVLGSCSSTLCAHPSHFPMTRHAYLPGSAHRPKLLQNFLKLLGPQHTLLSLSWGHLALMDSGSILEGRLWLVHILWSVLSEWSFTMQVSRTMSPAECELTHMFVEYLLCAEHGCRVPYVW